ncbi:hypothetical protein [Acidithiobacillus albertensis]|uniref:hypothetical protein n=1 Tax=Acidithiobacillus albertensis TaxID=119978 RepID=UPI001C071B97|nr:hypothetical protein [Acidithiobacillus albertensis]MBU2742577.1 hypothetical protein [Acidithiobacillus albertensis]
MLSSSQDPTPPSPRHFRPSQQTQPDIGDPQFQEWFERNRGAKDLNLQSVKDLCMASLIMAARDLLATQPSAQDAKASAQYWVDHPEETALPFSFCCHMVGIRLSVHTAQRMYLENLVAIAGLNMPNTGFPLESL